eukprot:9486566-Pyramimonas_sp.AAC.1
MIHSNDKHEITSDTEMSQNARRKIGAENDGGAIVETAAVADVVGRRPKDVATEDALLQALHAASRDPGAEPGAQQDGGPRRGHVPQALSKELPVHLPPAKSRNEPRTHS